jgi:hypothetical protein
MKRRDTMAKNQAATQTVREQVDNSFRSLAVEARKTARVVRFASRPKGFLGRLGLLTRTR